MFKTTSIHSQFLVIKTSKKYSFIQVIWRNVQNFWKIVAWISIVSKNYEVTRVDGWTFVNKWKQQYILVFHIVARKNFKHSCFFFFFGLHDETNCVRLSLIHGNSLRYAKMARCAIFPLKFVCPTLEQYCEQNHNHFDNWKELFHYFDF